MNPWASNGTSRDDSGAMTHRAPLGGLQAFTARNQLHTKSGLYLDTSASSYSSVQLVEQIERLAQLKGTTLERVRELEKLEAHVATAGVLLPRQLESKLQAVRSLRGDLEEFLAMKSVLLRTLQKNVASEYLDLEMQHQRHEFLFQPAFALVGTDLRTTCMGRTFIDLFLRLSDELPRYASDAVRPSSSAARSSTSGASVAQEVRQRHKEYETAVSQCKATIAKFHLVRDDMERVRAAYGQLHQVTLDSTDSPAYVG